MNNNNNNILVYINDLPAKLQSKARLFADDTIVHMAVTNETDAAILQKRSQTSRRMGK